MSIIAENHRRNVEEVRAGRTHLSSYPLQVNVELTGICNINPPCVFCSGKNFGHNYAPLDPASLDKYQSFLEHCDHVNEDSFGEPLSHPALLDTARRFTSNGQMFSFVTNGLLLTRAKADGLAACGKLLGIHVSFNAATEETFHRLTGRSLAPVIRNVRYYVESYRRQNDGAEPDLILTFIVMKMNRHEVAPFLHLVKELGGRALLASLHDRPSIPLGHFGYDFVYEEEMLPYEELARIGRDATAVAEKLGIRCVLQWDSSHDSAIREFSEPGVATPCLIPWRFLFIQEHTRKVFACPYHRHPYGDLDKQTIDEIWNGETAQEMRRSLAAGEIPKFCYDNGASCPLIMKEGRRDAAPFAGNRIVVGENDYRVLGTGWYPLERAPDPVRWTAQSAEFFIKVGDGPSLQIEAAAWGPPVTSGSIHGRLALGEHDLGTFRLDREGWTLLDFPQPRSLAGSVARGQITVDQTFVPRDLGLGGDTRRLGIAVRRIASENAVRKVAPWRLTWRGLLRRLSRLTA